MSGIPPIAGDFADRALRQLRELPALTVSRPDHGPGSALGLRSRQIVHLHGYNEAEVHLTRDVVRRMTDAFDACDHVTVEPDKEWVRVRLESASDVAFLISLVSVAIKANAPVMSSTDLPIVPCPQATAAGPQPDP